MSRRTVLPNRYLWILTLLASCLLVQQTHQRLTLLFVTAVYGALALNHPASVERSLAKRNRWLLMMVIGAELVLFFVSLVAQVPLALTQVYAVLIPVALAPIGQELVVAYIIHRKHHRADETLRTAQHYATEDALALLGIITLSFAATAWRHTPPVLSIPEVLLLTCIVRPLLSGRLLQASQEDSNPWPRIMFASLITYGSYLFFFLRHYLSPGHLDPSNPLAWRASTVAVAVFAACQAAFILRSPGATRIAGYHIVGITGSLLLVSYLPPLHAFFMSYGLSPVDWLCIIIAGLLYVALILLQLQSSAHSQKAVLALHKAQQDK